MKSLKEMLHKKPYLAVDAMIRGLDNPPENFVVNMDSFGGVITGVCEGGAATLALQKLSNHEFTPEEIYDTRVRSEALGFDYSEVFKFETAMDSLRMGDIGNLADFCNIRRTDMPAPYPDLDVLDTKKNFLKKISAEKIITFCGYFFPKKFREEAKGDIFETRHEMIENDCSKIAIFCVTAFKIFSLILGSLRIRLSDLVKTENEMNK